MKLKKALAIGLSVALMMSASSVYAGETDMVTFGASSDSVEEEFVPLDEQECKEDISEVEIFSSGCDGQQMIKNETDEEENAIFIDEPDDVQMAGIVADNRAPVIESIAIDKHDVTVGDTVTVTATITDESGIKTYPLSPYIHFYMRGAKIHEIQLEAQGNNIYKGSITIKNDFVNGTYVASSCYIEDIYSNRLDDYSFTREYPDLYFKVSGAKEDNKAPVIESITINKHDVTVGDTVTITAIITDESGIKTYPLSPYIHFYMRGAKIHEIQLEAQGDDIYKGSIIIKEDFVNGTYAASSCYIEDIYSNRLDDYSFTSKYPNLYFKISGAEEDNRAPVIESITINKHDVTVGDTVTVTATITDESGIKTYPLSPYIHFYMRGAKIYEIQLKAQGNNIYKGSITIKDDFVNGTYAASSCYIEDIYSNRLDDYSFTSKYPDLYFRVFCDNHTWDQATIVKDATCTDNGEKQYKCIVCGITKMETVPTTGHKEVPDQAAEATCETSGKTEGSHCSVCGKVLVPQEVIPALGHSWDQGTITKEATCEETGSRTYTCTVCGKTQNESINSSGHKEVTDQAVAATCEANGKTEGSHCSVCDKVLVSQQVIPALGHRWDQGTITKEATCEETGIKTYTCTACGKTQDGSINALGHKEVTDQAVAATCGSAGKTEGSHCSVCGKILVSQKVIPASGHSWNNGVIVRNATCEGTGSIIYTCRNCDKTKFERISALGHKRVTDQAVSATCEAAGKTEGSHCSVCGKILAEQITIPATGHSWDKGIITKAASCTESGVKTYTCVRCQKTKEQKLNASGHKFGSWKTFSQATVFAPRKQIRICNECGMEEKREIGSKLRKTIKVSASSIPLRVKQKTTVLKVTGLAKGDSIVSWKSNDTRIAKVSGRTNGTCTIIAGNKIGKARITITLKSGLRKNITVSVQKGTVKTQKITGIAKTLNLKKRQKASLHPILTPLTSIEKVTYKSSNSKIATVNSKGQITAREKGTVIITVKSGSKSVKCKVTVK